MATHDAWALVCRLFAGGTPVLRAALSPREVAFLVSLIPGPVKYQASIQGGEVRRGFDTLVNNLLVKMRSVDVISEERFRAALVENLVFRAQPPKVEDSPQDPIGQ